MDKKVKRYYQLKQQQKDTEQELAALREEIVSHCKDMGVTELEIGSYRVRTIRQERKEYDDQRLFEALPEPGLWRLASRADTGKVAGLIKLGVLTEEMVKQAVSVKPITLLQIERK